MKNSERRRVCLIVLFGILLVPQVVAQTNITWTGTVSTDWNNPANWSPQQVPTSGDHVLISSNSVVVPSDAVFAIMDWSGGSIYGSLTVSNGGVLNIGGSVSLIAALTNAGTVNWLAGDVTIYGWYQNNNAGPIVNLAGGVWNVACDQTLNYQYDNNFSPGPNQYFSNAGLVRKTSGTGTTTVGIPFDNAGTVASLGGRLALTRGFNPQNGELLFGLKSLTDFGKIRISGNATLGGTVGIAWLNGYVPATNDSFTVLTYGTYSGIFTNTDLPPAALWETNYGPTSFSVRVAAIDKLVFTTPPAGDVRTNIIMPPVVVQIEHPIGDPVASNGVPVTLSLRSGSGTMSGTLTRNTDVTGKATFNDLRFDTIGSKTLRVTAPNLTPAVSAPFNIVPLVEIHWTSGGLLLRFNGTNDYGPTIIYASTDLETWTPIYTNPPTSGRIEYLDTSATNYPHRFYWALEP